MKKRHSLDKYTKLRVIGKGAFAKVYLIRSLEDMHTYALKRLKKSLLV